MNQSNLIEILTTPAAAKWFGRSFAIKLDVMVYAVTGQGTLTAIAKSHGVTPQAVSKHYRRAAKIFSETPQPKVESVDCN